MGLEQRPYIGTWKLNGKKVVQHTPDALVYINGDTAVPGCPKCNGRIPIQKFLTEISIDAGTQPGSASCSFTLSIPIHHHDNIARDANFLFRPGLEVHAYLRGYFPVKGLYDNLAEPTLGGSRITVGDDAPQAEFQPADSTQAPPERPDNVEGSGQPLGPTLDTILNNLTFEGQPLNESQRNSVEVILRETIDAGLPPTFALAAVNHSRWESNWTTTAENMGNREEGEEGVAFGLFQLNRFGRALGTSNPDFEDGKRAGNANAAAENPDTVYNAFDPVLNVRRILLSAQNSGRRFRDQSITAQEMYERFFFSGLGAGFRVTEEKVLRVANFRIRVGERLFGDAWTDPEFNQKVLDELERVQIQQQQTQEQVAAPIEELVEDVDNPSQVLREASSPAGGSGQSLLEEAGLGNSGLENILAYPYYHCFHGVVTRVDHSYSGGVQTISLQCNSMLHFWSYHNISSNASVFGARPSNSKLKTSLVGHNYTGMHPYEIMYSLYYDMAGAAGGVGYALRNKTNQTSTSEVGGESLYSLAIRYWEKRFNSNFNNLRLHGASGELFSAAQALFLSRLSSNRLTRLVRQRFADPTTRKYANDKVLSQAFSLNLFSENKLAALLFAQQSRPAATGSGGLEINLAEMQAYVKNLGEIGQVNLFESTYETKMNVAQKVMEVTGFEFYQDVDGDFVFKPPFYNMDTSQSRPYRIEDIDIISINHSTSEPEVTYMTIQGSQIENLQGTGLENEWGVRGQYIDYRKVAQFGWRSGSLQTSYLSDGKSMFYAAVNRMDILNVGSQAASINIPIRPEIRAGYPFYVEYLDCFYYCPSFAHQFSMGGQCTTSLQLVGRRSKFLPPGDPTKVGIEAIDLSNPYLPERPLEIYTPDGPRAAGLPNVVMALDPNQVNPLFLVVGSDLESLDTPGALANLFEMADQLGIVKRKIVDPRNPRFIVYTVELPADPDDPTQGTQQLRFSLDEEELLPDPKGGKKKRKRGDARRQGQTSEGTINVAQAAKAYQDRLQAGAAKVDSFGKRSRELQQLIARNEDKIGTISKKQAKAEQGSKAWNRHQKALNELQQETDEARNELAGLEGDLQVQQENFDRQLRNNDANGVASLLRMIDEIGVRYRRKHPDFGNLDSTSNLLDMLSDKKATFSNGSQPGGYRYYSASVPFPEDQGQPLWEYLDPEDDGPEAPSGRRVQVRSPSLEGRWQGYRVRGFLPSDQVTSPAPGIKRPEAQLGDIEVVNGIRVLSNNPDPALRRGEVVPTSEIKELTFSVQKVNTAHLGNSTFKITNPKSIGAQTLEVLRQKFSLTDTVDPAQSLSDLFESRWDAEAEKVEKASLLAKSKANQLRYSGADFSIPNFPDLTEPEFPLEVVLRGVSISTSTPFEEVLAEVGAENAQAANWTPQVLAEVGGEFLARSFFRQLARSRLAWISSLRNLDSLTGKQKKQVLAPLNEGLKSALGVKPARVSRRNKRSVKRRNKFSVQSPVFPVSDARGYKVIGSYRYGRDIDLSANNPLDVLHRQDPLSLLSRELVEEVLNLLASFRGGELTEEIQVSRRRGSAKRKVRVQQTLADINRRALEQFRQNLSDQQIIDLGLATPNTDDPSLLEFNLLNWFEEGNKEGINKLPIINAGLSLADLTRHTGKNVCQCKAAEAGIFLENIANEDFVNFAPGSYIPPDNANVEGSDVTDYLQAEVSRKGVGWQERQDALRGRVLDRAGSTLLETFSGAIEGFSDAGDAVDDAVDNFNNLLDEF